MGKYGEEKIKHLLKASTVQKRFYFRRWIILFVLLVSAFVAGAQIKVEYFLNKGINEFYNEQYTQAIQTFNMLIRAKPDLAEPHIYRGRAKMILGDFRGAEFDFTRAVMLDSYNPDAYYYRGVVKSNLFNYYSALEDFRKSLERRPDNPNVFYSLGTTKIRMGDYKGAIEDFDTLILLRPDIEEAFLNRAVAKARLERYEEAIADCNAAIKLNFLYTDAFIQRGLFENELGEFDKAMKDFDQAIKLDEKNPLTYFYRGAARIKMGDTIAAMHDFDQVIRLDPQNDLTYYNRALIKMERKDYEGALEDLKNVLRINPENVYTWYNMGYADMQLERYDDALESYSKAIELFPDFAAAYMSRSSVKQKMGDYEGAKKDYDTGIAIVNAVNSGEDFGSINQGYSADSTYLRRLIEFEADFNSNGVSGGRVQYRQVFIQLKPNIIIVYLPADEVISLQLEKGYHYKSLDELKYNDDNFAYGLSSGEIRLSDEVARNLNAKIDSVQYFDPFNAENYFRKGTFNAMMMNFNDALRAFNRAVELEPGFQEAYFNRANINFELIEHQYSIEESDPQITITRNAPQDKKKVKHQGIPDFSSVLADYDRVIELDPQMSYAYYNRGNIKNRMRDFEGAVQDYNKALALQPNLAEAFYNRALTLIYLKKTADACLDLSKAGELGIQDAYNVIKRYCNN